MRESRTVSSFRQVKAGAVATIALFMTAALTPGPVSAAVGEWEIHGPPGNIMSLAVAPSEPSTLYGGQSTGVVKSTDGGRTWRGANHGLPLSTAFEGIAVHPFDADTAYAASTETGVYKSIDGGQTWVERSEGLLAMHLHEIVIDPVDPQTVYAGGEGGPGVLFKSTDGGQSWVDITDKMGVSLESIAIDPNDHMVVYVGLSGGRRFLKSIDGGATWVKSSTGIPKNSEILALAVDPSNPSIIYAGRDELPSGPTMYRSTDGGATWSSVGDALITDDVNAIVIDPTDPSTVYAGADVGVYKSTDGGDTWDRLSGMSPVVDALVLDPASPFTLYASQGPHTAGDGPGVYKTTNGGETWKQYTEGVPGGSVHAVREDSSPTRKRWTGATAWWSPTS